nr:unnamed protein product [Callosobruchus chinensis]
MIEAGNEDLEVVDFLKFIYLWDCSYSYDLSHTLQYNLTSPKRFVPNISLQDEDTDIEVNNTDHLSSSIVSGSSNLEHPETQHYGVRTQPHKKFVWNMHLLRDALKAELHPDWLLLSLMAFVGSRI